MKNEAVTSLIPLDRLMPLDTVDNISAGRLDAGFGRAFIPKEFEVFGVSMEDSRARFEEELDIVTRLWTEDRVSYHGTFHAFDDVHLMPRPFQKPHPPIWIAAIASKESFVWAGQRGYNLMIVPYAGDMRKVRDMVRAYRDAWRDAGHTPGTEQVQTSLHCYMAETRAKAVEGAKPRVDRYIDVFTEAVSSWANHRSAQYAGYNKMVESIANTTVDSMLENNQALIGTPDEVVEQLKFQIDAFGEIEPSMQINFGGAGDQEAFRTLELFATHVMPRFPLRSASE